MPWWEKAIPPHRLETAKTPAVAVAAAVLSGHSNNVHNLWSI